MYDQWIDIVKYILQLFLLINNTLQLRTTTHKYLYIDYYIYRETYIYTISLFLFY